MARLEKRDKNFHVVYLGEVKFYFSYETLIAYRIGETLTISKNDWSKTTGNHLNKICANKRIRIPYKEFVKREKEMAKLLLIENIMVEQI